MSVTRDLAVPADLFAPKDLACLGGTFPRDCFTMPWCEYETYAFQCGSDHHYHCIDYQATLCPDGGT